MKNTRAIALRVGGAGLALLVVAGAGSVLAFGGGLPKAAPQYSLTKATMGSIAQTWSTSGAISRSNQSVVAFTSSGTVNSIKVQLGQSVNAGDVLATLDPTQLQLSVTVAKAAFTQAEAQLSIDQAASSTTATASSSGASGASGTAAQLATLQAELKALSARLAAAEAAGTTSKAAAQAATALKDKLVSALIAALASPDCTATFAQAGSTPAPTPHPSASPSETPSPSVTPIPSETPSPSATDSPSATPSTSAPSPSASVGETPTPSASPTTLSMTLPTADQVAGCRALFTDALTAAHTAAGGPTAGSAQGSTPSPSPTGATPTSSTTGATASVAAAAGSGASSGVGAQGAGGGQSGPARVASDRANLLGAQQNLATATQSLAGASLVAPMAGRIATIGYSAGQQAGGRSITIIGDGAATVTINVPVTVRPLITNGEAVTVTVPGSTTALAGSVTHVNDLANSGTAGSNPTYATQLNVPDPQGLLFAGGVAGVTVQLGSVDNVTVVPGSAITPTGTGTGTVQLPGATASAAARTITVMTGATGQGLVQIVSGLSADQVVILADLDSSVPANSFQQRFGGTQTTARASSAATPTG